ncbi:MAG: ketoacyl-ACP synthase III [Acidobacteria bacterium]|nr:ketoacyl-ACP synthase III [Acidobacteriota bacterium]
MMRSRIISMGHYVPERIVKNSDLEKLLDIRDEDIVKRTGVRERRYVTPGTSCADIACEAARKALAQARMEPRGLDLIILATLSPDHFFPGSGCFLQAKLNAPGIPAIDIRDQCSGFLYGLSIADQFIRTETYRNVLVVGSEVHSTGLDFSPEASGVSIIFGDGAGAAILGPAADQPGIIACRLHADGRFAHELMVAAPGTRHHVQIDHEMIDKKMHYPRMNGRAVFRSAVTHMTELVEKILQSEGLNLKDIALFVFHQANLRIIEAVASRLGIEDARLYNNIDRYGNTTAAAVPIALSEAVGEKRISQGDLVMLVSFGSGFTWAGVLLRWLDCDSGC